jgi:hypothetical protein
LSEGAIVYSFNKNKKLGFINSNVPVLNGFYQAHINHYPIRIKPDDIWLLIVQAFSHHVNENSEELRKYFVHFYGKKRLELTIFKSILNMSKIDFELFAEQINEQMKVYLGKEIIENLTPNFTTTDYDSKMICKLSIMGTFQQYFDFQFNYATCGIPYIILEGTSEDYRKIKNKAKFLKKYKFEWYINRITPILQKMIDAKEGYIDTEFFKNIVQEKEDERQTGFGCSIRVAKENFIKGWIVKFFAYNNEGEVLNGRKIAIEDFHTIANQLLSVPFTLKDLDHNLQYEMEYKVGFIGCEQNYKNETFPVQGWFVSKQKNNVPTIEFNSNDNIETLFKRHFG